MKKILSYFLTITTKQLEAFTLLETLVSIAIISAVVIGPLTVAVNSSSYARQTKDTMTSTYLAEESLELLHHQYDSLYLACINDIEPCHSFSNVAGEEKSQKAWRFFKYRLHGGTDTSNSCFKAEGCTYDFLDMTDISSDPLVSPPLYNPNDTDCPQLSLRSALMGVDIIRKFYVCSEVSGHKWGTFVLNPFYSRTVYITSIPTFSESDSEGTFTPVANTPNLDFYNDDLRVVVNATFKRVNGMTKTISIVDFIHARL